jgi:hypothetical protein
MANRSLLVLVLVLIALLLLIIAFVCSLPTPGVFLTLGAQSWALGAFIALVLAWLVSSPRIPKSTRQPG